MKEEWLLNGAVVPVDVETTAALVAEIHRLIGVVGGMALAQVEQPAQQEPVACRFCFSKKGRWTWQCYSCNEIDDVQQPATPLLVQPEPPQYSLKTHWTDDKRIGVVACVTRPDGGVHLMQTIIDLPPEQF